MTFVDRCRRARYAHRRNRKKKQREEGQKEAERLEKEKQNRKMSIEDLLKTMSSVDPYLVVDFRVMAMEPYLGIGPTTDLTPIDAQLLAHDDQPKFKFFPRLPIELRLMIYELLLPEPRHIDLSKELLDHITLNNLKWLDKFNIAPVTHYINHESREFTAKFYHTYQLYKLPRQYENVWFSPKRDTIGLNVVDILKTSTRKKNIHNSILKWSQRLHNFDFLFTLFSRVTKVECAFSSIDLGRHCGDWRVVQEEAKKGITRTWVRSRALPYLENVETITVALISAPWQTPIFQGFKDELENYAEFVKWTCVEMNKVNTKFCLPRVVLAWKEIDEDGSTELKGYRELEYDVEEGEKEKDESPPPIKARPIKGQYGSLA